MYATILEVGGMVVSPFVLVRFQTTSVHAQGLRMRGCFYEISSTSLYKQKQWQA